MRCQICSAFSDKDIAEYNENTGKMDFICGTCKDSVADLELDYAEQDLTEEDEIFDYWDDDQDYWEE